MFGSIIIEEHENHSKRCIHKHTSSQKIYPIHQHLNPMAIHGKVEKLTKLITFNLRPKTSPCMI